MPSESPPPFIDITDPQRSAKPKEPIGPIIGTVIIVALLICGVLYFWVTMLGKQEKGGIPLIAAGAGTSTR